MKTEIPETNSSPPKYLQRLQKLMSWTRWFSVITVLSSLVGALLMFVIGADNTVKAVMAFLALNPEMAEGIHLEPGESANLLLLESLDNALTGLTFLYFAYGIYSLFLANPKAEAQAPNWLKVESIGTLKKTLLEVVVVLLSISFVRNLAERLLSTGLRWEILVIPLSIVAIALSTKLMGFEEDSDHS